MAKIKTKQAAGAALAAVTLLALAACSDPGASAASAPYFRAAALVPDAIKADGKLTVVTTGGSAPLTLFATDNKTLIGSEVDIAYAVGETLGLEVECSPWPGPTGLWASNRASTRRFSPT